MSKARDKDEQDLLNFQSMYVIKFLMENFNLRRAYATSIWYSSRTKEYIKTA